MYTYAYTYVFVYVCMYVCVCTSMDQFAGEEHRRWHRPMQHHKQHRCSRHRRQLALYEIGRARKGLKVCKQACFNDMTCLDRTEQVPVSLFTLAPIGPTFSGHFVTGMDSSLLFTVCSSNWCHALPPLAFLICRFRRLRPLCCKGSDAEVK